MNRTADYIDFDKVINKGQNLLNDKKKCRLGFLLIFSVNSGLRISDILSIKHQDLLDEKVVITEKKTGKQRVITLNQIVRNSYLKLISKLKEEGMSYSQDDYIFISQKGTTFRTQTINGILKTLFKDKRHQISSHSLRKAFARRVYENMNQSEDSLVLLSEIFSHSSISITRRYLGIRKETIANVYLSLV
jgi:site-specific recombinase XerD